MSLDPRAGKPATQSDLTNIPRLISSYYLNKPDMSVPEQRVSFGTSGHRGSSLNGSFTQSHIRAITQAIVDYRTEQGITGPLFVGMDTHALSEAAQAQSQGKSWPGTKTAQRIWLTASSLLRPTTLLRMADSSTIPLTAVLPVLRSPHGSRKRPMSISRTPLRA